MVEPLIGYGFPSPAGTFLAPGLGVFRGLAAGWFSSSDGPKFVELDQLLDAVSTGPRWLERRDMAGVVANALWKGVGESRYELGAWVLMPNHVHIGPAPWAIRISLLRSGALRAAAHTQQIGY